MGCQFAFKTFVLVVGLVLGVVIANVQETDKACDFDENCVKKETCASFSEKHKKFKAVTNRDSLQYSQLRKELSDAVCNKRKRAVCCPKCGESDQCIARTECDYADEKTKLYKQLKGQRKRVEADKVLKELKDRVCEKKKRFMCCPKRVLLLLPSSNLPSSNLPKLGQCGLPTNDASSVTGGDDTRPGEFPFAALLGFVVERKVGGTRGSPGSIKKETKWSCAGTLITNVHVLTAAHCQGTTPERKISKLRLGVWKVTGYGGGGGNKREELPAEQDFDISVSAVRSHEGYATVYENDHKNVVNDIAVIKLPRPATLNKGVQIACLPAFAQEFKNYLGISDEVSGLIGSKPTVIGWGKTQAHQLANWNGVGSVIQQKLKLPLLSKAKCMDKNNNFIPRKTQLCAGGVEGEDSCRGDSGGGLFIQESETERDTAWYLIGIVSFGSRECGNGRAGLYTRVTEFIPWIKNNMK